MPRSSSSTRTTTAMPTVAEPYWPTVHDLPVMFSRFCNCAGLGSSRIMALSVLVALRPVMRRICASIAFAAEVEWRSRSSPSRRVPAFCADGPAKANSTRPSVISAPTATRMSGSSATA